MGNFFSSSAPSSVESDRLRQEARDLRAQAQGYFDQTQNAWKRGDKKLASENKQNRLRLQKRADKCDRKAAAVIFKASNRGRGKDEVDLHGLFVKEAIYYVEKKIIESKRKKRGHLVIITGRGNNSENGIARLKPVVYDELIQRHKLRCTLNKPNEGCIYVEFVSGEGFIGWLTDAVCAVM